MSDLILTDQEIETLIKEAKHLPCNWRLKSLVITEENTLLQTVQTVGVNNNEFSLILRQNTINQNNFCLIVAVRRKNREKLFHLKRYDGKYKQHTNPIEKEKFYDFHIHTATERYQKFGLKNEDHYAKATDRYNDYEKALKCLLEDCNFIVANDPQISIFEGVYGSY